MDNVRLTFLFYRYVNKTCSEAERKELLRLLSDPANDAQAKALMGELWSHLPQGNLSSSASERILEKILVGASPANRPRFQLFYRIAASVIFILLSVGAIYYFAHMDAPTSYAVLKNADKSLLRFIELPDGSTVILNAGSRLHYPESFTDKIREVSLEGEAYFDIISDPSRQFIVHTGKITTTVLGTAFNIRAYPDQKNITVTVRRGKVQVSNEKTVIGIINRNQQITFNTRDEDVAQTTVKSHEVTTWMEKDIFFDDITLGQAIDQLEKRFGQPIDVENGQLSRCRFTGTFVKGEDLKQILTVLCEFNNASLKEKVTGGFVIEGGQCQP
jgi:transmembrane sensor